MQGSGESADSELPALGKSETTQSILEEASREKQSGVALGNAKGA